jgi:DNA-directed RNA polymerase specialized sigma subunit
MQEIRMVELARRGDTEAHEALVRRYLPFVTAKVAQYEHFGLDHALGETLGRVGLCHAIRTFPLGQVSFRPQAELHITREIITASKQLASRRNELIP